jgi:hypothetical protein
MNRFIAKPPQFWAGQQQTVWCILSTLFTATLTEQPFHCRLDKRVVKIFIVVQMGNSINKATAMEREIIAELENRFHELIPIDGLELRVALERNFSRCDARGGRLRVLGLGRGLQLPEEPVGRFLLSGRFSGGDPGHAASA